MAQTRELKRRIKSITSTRKVTKAMELVAASKMRRASQAALTSRTYALAAWELLTNLSRMTDPNMHPLLRPNQSGRRAVIVMTSDKGLVGGLNAHLLRTTLSALEGIDRSTVDVIAVGKKGESALRRMGFSLFATFPALSATPTLEKILPLAKLTIAEYEQGHYDRIDVIYSDFVSILSQKPKRRVILPLSQQEIRGMIEGATDVTDKEFSQESGEYLFEPSADAVLESVLRGLVEMQLYQALLEATASEHAARMVAMRNASDAASDLLDELTLEFNEARQAGITKDLAEITASRASMEG
jgi:F-type H+-transporting ATPase subunit gamma